MGAIVENEKAEEIKQGEIANWLAQEFDFRYLPVTARIHKAVDMMQPAGADSDQEAVLIMGEAVAFLGEGLTIAPARLMIDRIFDRDHWQKRRQEIEMDFDQRFVKERGMTFNEWYGIKPQAMKTA